MTLGTGPRPDTWAVAMLLNGDALRPLDLDPAPLGAASSPVIANGGATPADMILAGDREERPGPSRSTPPATSRPTWRARLEAGTFVTLAPFAMMVLRRPGRETGRDIRREGPVRHRRARPPGSGGWSLPTPRQGWCASSPPRVSTSPSSCPTTARTTPGWAATSPSTCPDGSASPRSAVAALAGGSRSSPSAPPPSNGPIPTTTPAGRGWQDNDFRFMAFSAAVARFPARSPPDVLHINDWHTGATLGMLSGHVPSVFTIHNLAYQGMADGGWAGVLDHRPEAYEWHGTVNPMSGAIALADRVVAVSPNYVHEIRRPEGGFGLDGPLRARGDALVGILNGIDTAEWNPATDAHLAEPYDAEDLAGKAAAAARPDRRLRMGAEPRTRSSGWSPGSPRRRASTWPST